MRLYRTAINCLSKIRKLDEMIQKTKNQDKGEFSFLCRFYCLQYGLLLNENLLETRPSSKAQNPPQVIYLLLSKSLMRNEEQANT